jgi:hypothetical protein
LYPSKTHSAHVGAILQWIAWEDGSLPKLSLKLTILPRGPKAGFVGQDDEFSAESFLLRVTSSRKHLGKILKFSSDLDEPLRSF